MANVRVYELAKELGVPSKELIARLAAAGVEVKSHSSSITEEQAALVRGDGVAPAAPKAAEPEAAEPEAAEPKAAEPKVAEPKAAEPKAEEPKAAEPKAAEPKAAEPEPAPAPPAESMEFIVDPTDPGAPARVSAGRKAAPTPKPKLSPLPPPPKKKPAPPPVAKPAPAPAAKPAAPKPAAAPAPAPAAKPAAAAPAAPAPAAPAPAAPAPAPAPADEGLRIERGASVQEFAELVGKSPAAIVKMLLDLGEMKTATQSMTDEEIELLAGELGVAVTVVSPDEAEHEALAAEEEELADDPDAVDRPPVVTVMGHVDHGKTSILDRIRIDNANVAEGEAGGITQHIGAYQVRSEGRPITFIDTPGHEAFTAMRARGAAVTDIAVLVVAADDGVMPQTVEAISHAKAAKVPIVVAVNKIDKEDADPSRVRQQLAEHELIPAEWGGDTEFVDVSAKADLNIDGLLDTITVVAEVEELKANPAVPARGVTIEAHLDKGRGPVATIIVRRGTLRVGDAIVCGGAFGKVRAMLDENGRPMAEAGPAAPAQILGFATVPAAGDDFKVVGDEREARQIAQERESKDRRADMVAVPGALTSLENLFDRVQAGEVSELVLIVKADVQGSLEALTDALVKLDTGEVKTKIIHRAVGAITENDVRLAEASGGLIIGFNVRPDRTARSLAEKEGVDIRTYRVIYEAVESIESALKGMLAPEFEEIVTGQAEVRQLFRVPRIGVVNGCYVIEGSINRNARVRVLRDGLVVFDGVISSLRRFKDDVKDVNTGYECGIGVENFQDTKEGDVIEAYELREIER